MLQKITFLLLCPKKIYALVRTMSQHVFVYGTLKRNEPNHYWLTDPNNGVGKFVSKGVTQTKYPLIIATRYNIPFLLYKPGIGRNIKGEIYNVDDLMLSKLDILEGHPDHYTREIDDIMVFRDGQAIESKTMKCWVYFLKKFKPELLSKPFLDDYSSKGDHGLVYLEKTKRDPNDNFKSDLY